MPLLPILCACENVEWDGRAQLNVKIFVSLEGSVHSFSSCLFIATNITNFDTQFPWKELELCSQFYLVLNLFQIFVDLVRLVINLSLDYEDIEGISIQVCEVLLEFEGYKGEIICPGVVPNYGPHVSTLEFRDVHMVTRRVA